MDAIAALRIRADMARELGHEDVARGIEIALNAVMPATPAAPGQAAEAEPRRKVEHAKGWEKRLARNRNQHWSAEDNEELTGMWMGGKSIAEMMERFGRSHRGVVAQALYKLRLAHRSDIRTHEPDRKPAEARSRAPGGDLLNV